MRTVCRVANWNLQFARPGSHRLSLIEAKLRTIQTEILFLTEAFPSATPKQGYTIASDPDYGYKTKDGRRKVLLWSRNPWEQVCTLGHSGLPPGRYIKGRTQTPVGWLTAIAVCIPWAHAHVSTGARNRRMWEEHCRFLEVLGALLRGYPPNELLIVAGDWNQMIPPRRVPVHVADLLAKAISPLKVATAGPLLPDKRHLIDHIAHSRDLIAHEVEMWSEYSHDGVLMSDHAGVRLVLSRADDAQGAPVEQTRLPLS